jgi:hypothetical protein
MDYVKFVDFAVSQDKRNRFEKYGGDLSRVPESLRPFYRDYNPIDVELDLEGIGDGVRFCPAGDIDNLQREYAYLNTEFVFATCNGDPVFFHEGHLYTCPHGISAPEWEAVSDPVLRCLTP